MENYSTPNLKDCYPLEVEYCGSCGLPCDLCIYFENYDSCLEWLKKKHPDRYQKLLAESLKNLQLRTTPSNINLKISEDNQYVGLSEKSDKNGKCNTWISGLSNFGVDVKNASECIAEIFHCVSSVEGEEVVVQGARKKELYNLLAEKWEIDPFDMEDLDELHPL
ncbi:unnamed protein product [Nezara viridula]|uniref:SUI1 domain-containing protein n=1 Tax=Nezara viridula TaxID=85310 RepID=A0A9P0EAM1_NEZVI|nr:unnamed protein product [Nezara viridula]